MSDTAHHSVICPGQRNLMPGKNPAYLRFSFTAYWEKGRPGAEIFYLTDYPVVFTDEGEAALKADVLAALKANVHADTIEDVVLNGYLGWELTDEQVDKHGWRVMRGQPASTNPGPVPEPLPEPPASDAGPQA